MCFIVTKKNHNAKNIAGTNTDFVYFIKNIIYICFVDILFLLTLNLCLRVVYITFVLYTL